MNKVVAFGDFVREHTAAVCALAGLIILILGLLLYRMNMNGKKLAAALEEAKREKEYAYKRNLCNNALEEKANQDALTRIGNRQTRRETKATSRHTAG